MKIFSSNRPKSSNGLRSTFGFYIGSPEAEAEVKTGIQNLEHYFEDFLNVIPSIHDGRFIIVGRKGAGKSAIAKFIQNQSKKERDSYCGIIKYNNINLEKRVQQDNAASSMFFEWLILVQLVKLLIVNKEGEYIKEYGKLRDFLNRNTGYVDIDKYQLVELLEKKGGEIKFEVLRHTFGGVINRYFDKKTTTAPFYRLIQPLREIVQTVLHYEIHKDKEYILLFDDLDIDFKESNKANIDEITNLLRIAKQYNTEVLDGTSSKIIVFVRDDIKNIIVNYHADTAKLFSSYALTLNWYDHDNFKDDENHTNLKKFISKRIELNFRANSIDFDTDDPWSSLIQEGYGSKSTFKHILDYTFYRPRDLILFFNPIGDEEYEYPLNRDRINILLRKMVIELVSELKNELSLTFSENEIRDLMTILQGLSLNLTITYTSLKAKFESTKFEKPIDDVIDILLKYSVIIPKDLQGKMFFNYRERTNTDFFNKDAFNYFLHNSLLMYFNS